jgi:hypothetical protein
MADVQRYRREADGVVYFPVESATVIEIGDLCAVSGGYLVPLSSLADQLTESANQIVAAAIFAGVARQRSRAGDTEPVGVNVEGEFEYPCPSTTWAIGELVGPSENGDGDGLLAQQVEKVTLAPNAIGTCVKAGTTVTSVFVRLQSSIVGLSKLLATSPSLSVVTIAAAGSAQGDAGVIPAYSDVIVVTGGNGTTGVVLPTAVVGDKPKHILNSGSAGLKIYPAASDKINNGSANAAIAILENTQAILVPTAVDNWAASFTVND